LGLVVIGVKISEETVDPLDDIQMMQVSKL
jgi:hypothetical protein